MSRDDDDVYILIVIVIKEDMFQTRSHFFTYSAWWGRGMVEERCGGEGLLVS